MYVYLVWKDWEMLRTFDSLEFTASNLNQTSVGFESSAVISGEAARTIMQPDC